MLANISIIIRLLYGVTVNKPKSDYYLIKLFETQNVPKFNSLVHCVVSTDVCYDVILDRWKNWDKVRSNQGSFITLTSACVLFEHLM